ncbi:MAG: hypothetical protein IPP32_09090 [Bacteroidetes bacterium]|nr:hypothetical protein [Bacteroidota bacterium]
MKKSMLILLLALAGRIQAQTPELITNDKTGWHKIVEKSVDLKRDRDEFTILGADRFASLKLFVKDVQLSIYDMEVYFENGTKQVIEVRSPIKAGGESKSFDLKGVERDIKKIVLVYKTEPNQKDEKASIEIWGMKSNEAPNKSAVEMPGIVLSDKKGWHKIGERTINWKMDHDEIVVVGADKFASIKFIAVFASIDIRSIVVHYESGDNQNITISNPILMGAESKVIDLTGGERAIKKIVFEYKTMPNRNEEKALVEVWGYKTNTDKK